MSDYQKYVSYKMKYLYLKKQQSLIGGNNINPILIYNKTITNIPTEYLQNVTFTIITEHGLNINDFNIKYVQELVVKTQKKIDLYIYSLKEIPDEKKLSLIKKLEEKLKEFIV